MWPKQSTAIFCRLHHFLVECHNEPEQTGLGSDEAHQQGLLKRLGNARERSQSRENVPVRRKPVFP